MDKLNLILDMRNAFIIHSAGTAHHTNHAIPLIYKEFRQVGPILPGNPRDKRRFQNAFISLMFVITATIIPSLRVALQKPRIITDFQTGCPVFCS